MEMVMASTNVQQSSEVIAQAMQALIERSNESGTSLVVGWGHDRYRSTHGKEVYTCGCGCGK
jgi:hypothetical protein